jgi:hypothetical protein
MTTENLRRDKRIANDEISYLVDTEIRRGHILLHSDT